MALGGQGGTSATTDLKKGLADRAPKADSFGAHGVSKGPHNINGDATRSSTAPTPKSLGPRSEG
jgi:hypothetical protein